MPASFPPLKSLPVPAAALLLLLVAAVVTPAPAVIMKLTPLAEILEGDDFIFVATVERLEPDRPGAVFKVERPLKGRPPYERLAVNMTGNDESKKANDTQIIFDRLDESRQLVFFVSKRGKNHNAKVFVEGSWFSVHGTEDPTDKTVRWAFQNGEPFLRRTFKGSSAELIRVIEDGLSGKAKPPAPNEKEKEGYGPPVQRKPKSAADPTARPRGAAALFAVIPSFVLVGPLAVVAALFPGLFARLAVGMKRWRAFLVVASLNGTLALVYWLYQMYWPSSGWWLGPQAFTLYLMGVSAVGLSWAGRRYRRLAAEDPRHTDPPGMSELLTLGGLVAFVAVCAAVVAWFGDWRTNLELPMREFTFIGIALVAALLYAAYRRLTAAADYTPQGRPVERRLSLSGETVGLLTLLLCGFAVVISGGSPTGPVAAGTQTGDADAIGPRLVGAVRVFPIPRTTQVISGIVVDGDRLYCGTQFVRSTQEGHLVCLDRHSGELKWKFGDDDEMRPVFCTPTLIDGKLYCGEGLHEDKDCRLFCVNAADGSPGWERPFKTASHTEGAPVLAGGLLCFPAGDDGVIALDPKTGTEKWRLAGGKAAGLHIDAAPAALGNRLFVGSGLYSFVAVALDAPTGTVLWRADLKLRSFGAPFASGKHVYFGVGTGNMGLDVFNYPEEDGTKEKDAAGAVVCLDADTGKELWRYELPRSVHPGLTGDAFSVYAACRDGSVYALDRRTGKLRWRTGIGGAVTAPPAVATSAGMPLAVYAVSREGTAVCLNPISGAILWQKPLPGYRYLPTDHNDVLSGPTVVSTPTPTGSRRHIYIGAMTVDPDNPAKKVGAVFRFEDEIGDD